MRNYPFPLQPRFDHPDRLFLQLKREPCTWRHERVEDTDIEYIQRDIARDLHKALLDAITIADSHHDAGDEIQRRYEVLIEKTKWLKNG